MTGDSFISFDICTVSTVILQILKLLRHIKFKLFQMPRQDLSIHGYGFDHRKCVIESIQSCHQRIDDSGIGSGHNRILDGRAFLADLFAVLFNHVAVFKERIKLLIHPTFTPFVQEIIHELVGIHTACFIYSFFLTSFCTLGIGHFKNRHGIFQTVTCHAVMIRFGLHRPRRYFYRELSFFKIEPSDFFKNESEYQRPCLSCSLAFKFKAKRFKLSMILHQFFLDHIGL